MHSEVIVSPGEFSRHELTGKTAIVIDIFRFTTTILTALEAGMESFFPVADIEEARALKKAHPNYLLAGERQALKIPGFDFGNSPLEHYGQSYQGGNLICSTTNGTRAIHAAKGAKQVVLASIRSAKAVAEYVAKQDGGVIFFPAGLEGTFSLEDTWCAGLILSYLKESDLGDGAKSAMMVYEGIPREQLAESTHGRRLQALDLKEDLEFCLELNASSRVILWDQKTGWGYLGR
ncbi:MAG TPA: 2-phosphosulfolactate phosphatase [Limnochordia bacterium]|nr:2-phosphosulfolactate phosphatase [Limnochordia bacterium]